MTNWQLRVNPSLPPFRLLKRTKNPKCSVLMPLTDERLKNRLAQNERLIINLYKYLFDSGLPADRLIALGQIVEQTDRRLFRKCLAFMQEFENERLRVSLLIAEDVAKFVAVLDTSSKDAEEADTYA